MLDATRKNSPQAITRLAQYVMSLVFGGAPPVIYGESRLYHKIAVQISFSSLASPSTIYVSIPNASNPY